MHRVMRQRDWREVLLDPPQLPFVAVVSLAGKTKILHRAAVALDRESFPVQVEEDRVWVISSLMAFFIHLVESALAAGWTRDEVLSGECRQSVAFRMGLGGWMRLRADLHRSRDADALAFRLAVLAAHRPDNKENNNVH